MPFQILTMWVFPRILAKSTFSIGSQISWGTKQDATPEIELGSVVQVSNFEVDVEVLQEENHPDVKYVEALTNVKMRKPIIPKGAGRSPTIAEKEQAAKDYYANVRTNVCRGLLSNRKLTDKLLHSSCWLGYCLTYAPGICFCSSV